MTATATAPPAHRDVKPQRAVEPSPTWRPIGSWGLSGAAPVNLAGQGNGLKLMLQCLIEDAARTRPDSSEAQRHLDAVAAELLRDAPEFRQYREAKKQHEAAKKAHAEALSALDEQVKAREELLTVMPGGLADKLAQADRAIAESRATVERCAAQVSTLRSVHEAKMLALRARLDRAEAEAIQQVRRAQQQALADATAAFVAEHGDELTNLARLAQARALKPNLARLSAEILGEA